MEIVTWQFLLTLYYDSWWQYMSPIILIVFMLGKFLYIYIYFEIFENHFHKRKPNLTYSQNSLGFDGPQTQCAAVRMNWVFNKLAPQ